MTEGWTGSGVGEGWIGTSEGWADSGDGRLCLLAAFVGVDGAIVGGAVDRTASLAGASGAGSKSSGEVGPPQAATASAMAKATAIGIRFTKVLRNVESIAQPAAKAGKMVSLKAANSRWG